MKNRKNITIELEIESNGFEGSSVARKDGLVYFVKGAIAGDKVNALVIKKKKKYCMANMLELLEPSPERIEPKCKYFGTCGGCSWQMLSYPNQLKWKRQHVIDSFEHIAKISPKIIEETIPSVREFHYRNKMEYSFSASRWLFDSEIKSISPIENKNFALGLHVPGRYDKVIDLDYCLIDEEINDEIVNKIRQKAVELKITAYNTFTKKGFLKNLALRNSVKNNEIMVILITDDIKEENEQTFIDWYKTEFGEFFPTISNIVHAINNKVTPVAIGSIVFTKGRGFITEDILGISYQISPFSFFQTNSYQLDRFIGKIIEIADIKPTDIVWDLYCGTGSITLPAAKQAKHIYGLELSETAIGDARKNAELNNLTNVEFFCEDLHRDHIPALLNSLPAPDVLIIDPPRAGMHKNLVAHLLELAPKRIVYVSCNPATQARDCEILSDKYTIERIVPCDMFPQTYHIESIALLERR
ncbi:MAG: 23S rRNA (uracil(1939)-C(5))-methyltransferase RlmD [bacterium]